MTLYSCAGVLKYSIVDGYYRCALELDPELHRYYRSLIPKYFACNRPKYPAHVTLSRGEVPVNNWGRYEGLTIVVAYSPYTHYDGLYWWLNVFSDDLTEIRLGMGLPRSYHLSRPPSDEECFHTTIGNSKG